jgi:hypothetical protein
MEINLDELAEWVTLSNKVEDPQGVLNALNVARLAQQMYLYDKVRRELNQEGCQSG